MTNIIMLIFQYPVKNSANKKTVIQDSHNLMIKKWWSFQINLILTKKRPKKHVGKDKSESIRQGRANKKVLPGRLKKYKSNLSSNGNRVIIFKQPLARVVPSKSMLFLVLTKCF